MSLKFSPTLRNAFLDTIAEIVGNGANLDLWSGAVPASCLYPPSGSLIASFELPNTWVTKAGTATGDGTIAFVVPQSTAALITGRPGYFRLLSADRTHCAMQGTVGAASTNNPPDLVIANPSPVSGQIITIVSLTITAPGA